MRNPFLATAASAKRGARPARRPEILAAKQQFVAIQLRQEAEFYGKYAEARLPWPEARERASRTLACLERASKLPYGSKEWAKEVRRALTYDF